eukprot:1182719-Prorocentrum_minimum.AAC.3
MTDAEKKAPETRTNIDKPSISNFTNEEFGSPPVFLWTMRQRPVSLDRSGAGFALRHRADSPDRVWLPGDGCGPTRFEAHVVCVCACGVVVVCKRWRAFTVAPLVASSDCTRTRNLSWPALVQSLEVTSSPPAPTGPPYLTLLQKPARPRTLGTSACWV